MFARQTHAEFEVVRWALILMLAAALMLLLSRAVGAGPFEEPLALAPTAVHDVQPMPPAAETPDPATSDHVWRALNAQWAGRPAEAVEIWLGIGPLAPEYEVWRLTAMGRAMIETGEWGAAEDHLRGALAHEPTNPLAHYFLGQLYLEQARWAGDWGDVAGHRFVGLVGGAPPAYSRDFLMLRAAHQFEAAIEHAAELRLDTPLAPPAASSTMALDPTVGDLLLATDAERFEFRAHATLGAIHLEADALETAEQHLDAAVAGGVDVGGAYRDLGHRYDDAERHLDAFRAYLKAIRSGDGAAAPAADAWDSFLDAWRDAWR